MKSEILAHTRVTAPDVEPRRWLLFLHGIYGSGRNWQTIARRVVEARPEWGALLVDLRLHGESTGFHPPHTLEACAADVDRLVRHLGIPAAGVLGHSFGGKVAMLYAARYGSGLRQLWVVESTPAVREPEGSAWRMLEVARSLPDQFASRQEAVQVMQERGRLATGIAQWMAMNLEPADDGLRWRLDFDGVEALLRDFFATELWPVIESPPDELDLHIIRATSSDTLDEPATDRVRNAAARSTRVHLHEVEGGHWINVENPDAVVELLSTHLV